MFPLASSARESNLLSPPSQVISLPPFNDSGKGNFSTCPSPIIGNPYNLAPSVSATNKVASSGERPMPFGVVMGWTTSLISDPSGRAQYTAP